MAKLAEKSEAAPSFAERVKAAVARMTGNSDPEGSGTDSAAKPAAANGSAPQSTNNSEKPASKAAKALSMARKPETQEKEAPQETLSALKRAYLELVGQRAAMEGKSADLEKGKAANDMAGKSDGAVAQQMGKEGQAIARHAMEDRHNEEYRLKMQGLAANAKVSGIEKGVPLDTDMNGVRSQAIAVKAPPKNQELIYT